MPAHGAPVGSYLSTCLVNGRAAVWLKWHRSRSIAQLGSLFDGSSVAGLSDRQLLERFNGRRDLAGEAAFAALVARHGPMVLGVCRQLLGDHHHAEDAFQAVFLVLARKARSLREPELLGNWLYGVSLRTARKARGRLVRRRKTEEDGSLQRASAHPERRRISRFSIESRPRRCTTRSTACQAFSAWQSSSATSRASPSTRPRTGCDGPPARFEAGWPGRAKSSAMVWPAAAWPCPPPRSGQFWRPGWHRRPSHPSCAITPPGLQPPSRPIKLPLAAPLGVGRRHGSGGSSNHVCSTS